MFLDQDTNEILKDSFIMGQQLLLITEEIGQSFSSLFPFFPHCFFLILKSFLCCLYLFIYLFIHLFIYLFIDSYRLRCLVRKKTLTLFHFISKSCLMSNERLLISRSDVWLLTPQRRLIQVFKKILSVPVKI